MKCRVDGCSGHHAADQLVCRPHWFQLPYPVRREIWALYRAGEAKADEHRAACFKALELLNKIAARKAAGNG